MQVYLKDEVPEVKLLGQRNRHVILVQLQRMSSEFFIVYPSVVFKVFSMSRYYFYNVRNNLLINDLEKSDHSLMSMFY